MNQILFIAFGTPVSVAMLAMGLSGLAFVLLVLTLILGANGRSRDAAEAVARQADLQEKLGDLARDWDTNAATLMNWQRELLK